MPDLPTPASGHGDAAQALAHAAEADVSTRVPERYARQLAAHLGRKAEVVPVSGGGTDVVLPWGRCRLVTDQEADVLQLRAAAATESDLVKVTGVVGGHLERFGRRDGLTVTWRR